MPGQWSRTLEGYGKGQVVIGIRPGAVVQENRSGTGEGQMENEVVGVLEDLQPLVGETIVALKVGSRTWLSTVFQEVDELLRPDQAMRVGIDVEQVRLFDPDMERVLVAA